MLDKAERIQMITNAVNNAIADEDKLPGPRMRLLMERIFVDYYGLGKPGKYPLEWKDAYGLVSLHRT